jgi:hypothetical protein
MVHAIVAQILLDWCATATGQIRSDVTQRLACSTPCSTTSRGRFPKARQRARLTSRANRIHDQGG